MIKTFVLILSLSIIHTSTASSSDWDELLSQADSLSAIHNYDSAIIIGNLALAKVQATSIENDSVTAWILYRLGRYNLSLRRNAEANDLLEQARSIQLKLFGKNHPDVAVSTYYLGATYLFTQNYYIADTLLAEAVDIKEAVYGRDHPETAKCLIGYISLKKIFGDYSEAERLAKWALAIFEQDAESNKLDISKMLTILGDISRQQGRTTEAINLYTKAFEIQKTIPNVDDATIARNIERTAKAYYLSGHYSKAGPLYEEAIGLYKSRYGEDNSNVASQYLNMGLLNQAQGDIIDAEKLYNKALDIYNLREDENRVSIAKCLHYLGNLYYDSQELDQAEPMLLNAKEYCLRWIGNDHLDIAHINYTLGDIYLEKGNNIAADSLYLAAFQILENDLGPSNHFLLTGLNGLGLSAARQGRFSEAKEYLMRALNIEKEIYGENNLQYAKSLEILGQCYRLEKDFSNGLDYILESGNILSNNLQMMAAGMAEDKALLYARFLRYVTGSYLSCFFDDDPDSEKDLTDVASVVFGSKGPVSDVIIKRQKQSLHSDNPEFAQLTKQLREYKYDLANQFIAGSGVTDFEDYGLRLDSLREQIRKAEEKMGRLSTTFKTEKEVEAADLDRIMSSLPSGSILLEYLRYYYVDLKNNKQIPHYLAVVMDNKEIKCVKNLGEADKIDSLVSQYRYHMNEIATGGTKPYKADLQKYLNISNLLYEEVFSPVTAELNDSTNLFLSPDGSLNLISFASLPLSDGSYLIEKYPIQYLSTGRDLIRFKNVEKTGKGLFALGDPDYDATPEERTSLRKNQIFSKKSKMYQNRLRGVNSDCDNLRSTNISRLLGTRREIENIKEHWESNFENKPDIFIDSEASEENVKEFTPGKRVIHLATHGYFISSDCQKKNRSSTAGFSKTYAEENPLLYSGLFLAGANLREKETADSDTEDGILTAEEVSALNLSGCQWVVLSACESGLGELQTGEGVYGLRRAFQLAGSRTVISSLWPVSDQTTADMMKALYQQGDNTVPEILREMMLKQLRKLRKRHQPDHPVNWAAFISIGDWRGL